MEKKLLSATLMGFSEELVKNRKAAKMTQEDLAEKCNVSRQAIAKWEKAESLPDVYTIAKLARLFDISIEDLIWSNEDALVENKMYYVRPIQETDKGAFLRLMREHRWFGSLLKSLDTFEENNSDNKIWDTYATEGNTYVICTKEMQEIIGYFYVEASETSAPQMTMQFSGKMKAADYIVDIAKLFFDMLYEKHKIRAIQVFVNSELEQQIFRELGYENAKEEVVLALPL